MKSTSSLSNSDQPYGSIDGANHVNGTANPNPNWFYHKKLLIGFAAAALALLGTGMVATNKLNVLDAKVHDMVNRQAVANMSDRAHVSMMDHHKARASSFLGIEKQEEDPCGCLREYDPFMFEFCSVNGEYFNESNIDICVVTVEDAMKNMNEDGKACAKECLAWLQSSLR